ncbi:hypothetical protein BGZ74_008921 [Mortierella antarctica]|nr:hypothetical protein BGZ74_008921 [Mortierella antarctica]
MLKKIAQGDFLEHAVFSDNMYGTSRQTVQDVKDSGKIFLEQRLRGRGTETEQAVQKRLETARRDWEYGADPAHFDHVVVNDSMDKAYQDLCDYIFDGRKMKQSRL